VSHLHAPPLCVAGGQSLLPFQFLAFSSSSMRLSLLVAFWATLLTLVFASYVHRLFPLLNPVDVVASWLMLV